MIFLLACILFAGNAFAASQIPERLIYNDATMMMFSTPLESFFSEVDPKPKIMVEEAKITACVRGYIGTWKIENGYLYLVSLRYCMEQKEIPLSLIFPFGKPPIEAIWFTGVLRIPQGKMLKYRHMGFLSDFEKDLFIEIKEGKYIKEWVVDNTQKGKKEEKTPVELPADGSH